MSTRKAAKKGGPAPKPKKDFNSKIRTQDKGPFQGARSGGCLMCGGCQITGHRIVKKVSFCIGMHRPGAARLVAGAVIYMSVPIPSMMCNCRNNAI